MNAKLLSGVEYKLKLKIQETCRQGFSRTHTLYRAEIEKSIERFLFCRLCFANKPQTVLKSSRSVIYYIMENRFRLSVNRKAMQNLGGSLAFKTSRSRRVLNANVVCKLR